MTMRFGILGAARIARNSFVPGVRGSRQAQLYAVASRDLDRARAFANELEIPRVHNSYAELLADPDIDVVYIALPNNLHAEWTIASRAVLGELDSLLWRHPELAHGRRPRLRRQGERRADVMIAQHSLHNLHALSCRRLLWRGFAGCQRARLRVRAVVAAAARR